MVTSGKKSNKICINGKVQFQCVYTGKIFNSRQALSQYQKRNCKFVPRNIGRPTNIVTEPKVKVEVKRKQRSDGSDGLDSIKHNLLCLVKMGRITEDDMEFALNGESKPVPVLKPYPSSLTNNQLESITTIDKLNTVLARVYEKCFSFDRENNILHYIDPQCGNQSQVDISDKQFNDVCNRIGNFIIKSMVLKINLITKTIKKTGDSSIMDCIDLRNLNEMLIYMNDNKNVFVPNLLLTQF